MSALLKKAITAALPGGLSLLKNTLKQTFIVTNCDTILEGEYIDFFNWHKERRKSDDDSRFSQGNHSALWCFEYG